MVAVPTSILSAGFMETLEKQTSGKQENEGECAGTKDETPAEKTSGTPDSHSHTAPKDDSFEPPQYCPHCGKKLFP